MKLKKWSDELNSKRFFIKNWKLQEEYKAYFYEKKQHGTDFPTMYLLFKQFRKSISFKKYFFQKVFF